MPHRPVRPPPAPDDHGRPVAVLQLSLDRVWDVDLAVDRLLRAPDDHARLRRGPEPVRGRARRRARPGDPRRAGGPRRPRRLGPGRPDAVVPGTLREGWNTRIAQAR